jgi:hypothetical protein
VEGKAFTLDLASLPDAGFAYLLQYGFSKSMGDSNALSNLEKAKQAEKAGILPAGFSEGLETNTAGPALKAHFAKVAGSAEAFAAWEKAFMLERATDRFNAIVAGEMVFGSSERLSPEEKDRREITLEYLTNHLAKRGTKPPRKADELNPMLEKVYAVMQAEIDKIVARRAKDRAAAAAQAHDKMAGLEF